MRRLVTFGLLSLAAFAATLPAAEAQTRRRVAVVETVGQPLVVRVRPRSFLDAGNVVLPGTTNAYATRDITSYVNAPPYANMGLAYGAGILPDPVTGPFIGARNPFGPVDFAFR